MPLALQLILQVTVSILVVFGVYWSVWRLPRRGDTLFGWGPPLALGSAWLGLLATIVSVLLWVLPYPDPWIVAVFLLLDPGSIAAGSLVLWIYRGHETQGDAIAAQRLQAKVGLVLGWIAVGLGYAYVMSHKAPFTAVGT